MKLRKLQSRSLEWYQRAISIPSSFTRLDRVEHFIHRAIQIARAVGVTPAELDLMIDKAKHDAIMMPNQAVGATLVTLSAVAGNYGLELDRCAKDELERLWDPKVVARCQDRENSIAGVKEDKRKRFRRVA